MDVPKIQIHRRRVTIRDGHELQAIFQAVAVGGQENGARGRQVLHTDRAQMELRRDKCAFDFRIPDETRGAAEDILIDTEANRRLVVRGRHEDALLGRDLRAEDGGRIEVREENQDVVLVLIAFEILEESGAPGSLLA